MNNTLSPRQNPINIDRRLPVEAADAHRGPEMDPIQEARAEKHTMFDELLFELRRSNVRVSTSEWLDFQALLDGGHINSVEELFLLGRAVLIKDVTSFGTYKEVFRDLFYNEGGRYFEYSSDFEVTPYIDPDEEDDQDQEFFDEEDEDEIEYDDWEDDWEDEVEITQKAKEHIEEVAPNTTNTSQDVHGGNEATKDIENSPNPADQGKNKGRRRSKYDPIPNKQASRVTSSAVYKPKSKALQREFSREDFPDRNEVLTRKHFGEALSQLRRIISENTHIRTTRLNTEATVARFAESGGLPEFVWEEEIEDKPEVVLLFDVGGSTDPYRPIVEKLFAAAEDEIHDLDIFYFHNAIYGDVWPREDGSYGKRFISLGKILDRDPKTKIIIVGDAQMAPRDLTHGGLFDRGEDFLRFRQNPNIRRHRYHSKTGLENFAALVERFPNIVWFNPDIKRYYVKDEDSTLPDIEKVVPMFDLSLSGLEAGITHLMREI